MKFDFDSELREMLNNMAKEGPAEHQYRWAIVRIKEEYSAGSVDPPGRRIFRAGETVEMIEVTPGYWWDSLDIDGAHIIEGSKVEVIRVLKPNERHRF